MKVYLLPGIGCDHRMYDRFDLEGLDVHKLDWPPFPKGCTLAEIAQAMSAEVDTNGPHILAGVSMGGMVAQELAAITKPVKVVLISSWTGPQEWPLHARLGSSLRLHHLITHFTAWATWPVKRVLGRRDRATDRLLWEMARKETVRKIRNGTGAILRWKGSPWTGTVVRIHGDKDRVVPMRFPVDHVVRGGAHIMVLMRAEDVSRALRAALTA
jgi:pimeloyl-ACP methyl ester carboxylesterase